VNSTRLHVTGIVQGVGFRPFVRRLALRLDLPGYVRNTADGVCIQIPNNATDLFQQQLIAEQPRLARIDGIVLENCDDELSYPFEIRTSSTGIVTTGVAPDAAICADCTAELNDPTDRRFGYPFLNCTNCGPRFSIVHGIPYDRSNTTMNAFELCNACQSEYNDVSDRRYHAQPVACPDCGPQVWFESKPDSETKNSHEQACAAKNAIQQAIELLQSGGLLAVRGIGGFHLACLASNEEAVAKLRLLKSRPAKPFAIMVRDSDVAKRYALIDPGIEKKIDAQLSSPAAPIVLLQLRIGSNLASSVLCGLGKVGIMLPYSPLHLLLLDALNKPLVMTSGNDKGAPQVTGNESARREFANIVDGWLMHNREIENRIDDSVVQISRSNTSETKATQKNTTNVITTQVLRRARGLAPHLISLPEGLNDHPDAIAFGADSKNTFALAKGGQAMLSQHMGDLGDLRTAKDLLENIERLTELFDVKPGVVMCDLHNGYHSTRMAHEYAKARDLPIISIQHHHAHAASLMVEHQLHTETEIIALVQDGTGLGPDGDIWGAEVLRVKYDHAVRIATLLPAAMPGGDAAAQEPWRNLVARLYAHYGLHECWPPEYSTMLADYPVQPVCAAIEAGINAPFASSTGRLFDAVAAALGYAPTRLSYEGESAMRLEHAAVSYIKDHGLPEPLSLLCIPAGATQDVMMADPAPLWDALLQEIQTGQPQRAAARFHLGWADIWAQVALQQADETPIALSGGSFQNQLLSNRVADRLEKAGRRVILHSAVPPNDGGIALGQLAVGLSLSGDYPN